MQCSRGHFAKHNLSCSTVDFQQGITQTLFSLCLIFSYIFIVQQVRNQLHYFPHFINLHFSHTPSLLHFHRSYLRCVSVPLGECYVRMMDRWFWFSWQERPCCIFCTHYVGLAGNLGNEFRSQGNSGCVCKEFCEDLLSEEWERESKGGGKREKRWRKRAR